MASPELTKVIELLRALPRPESGTTPVGFLRAAMDAMAEPAPSQVAVREVTVAGCAADWLVPKGADPSRRLLYLHGGGYVAGSRKSHRALASRIARASGVVALLLEYRLAPESPFPAALDDARAALAWMRENSPEGPGAAARTFIAGDSAGGGLTLATLLAERAARGPLPDAAVTLSAWTDLAVSGESMRTHATRDPMISDADVGAWGRHYAGQSDPREPLVSPLYGDLAGLPPVLMHVGEEEVLLDDTLRFATRARAAGSDVTSVVFPELFHVFHVFAGMLSEAREAIGSVGDFLRAR